MKKLYLNLAILFSIVLFSSCSSYQFATLKSDLEQPFSDGFIYENDTIQLHYAFNGLNCPLQLSIYNKLNQPIYIDYNRSSLIINGETFPLNPETSSINVNYSETETELNHHSYTDGHSSGSITHNDRRGFIPPQSLLKLDNVNICNGFMETKLGSGDDQRTLVAENGQSYNVKAYDFTRENSPLLFRSFVSYKANSKEDWKYIDSNFWVSSIYQTVDTRLPAKANQFFVSRSTGVGEVVGLAALTGLAIIAIDSTDIEEDDSF
ncbi:MAG: hypothetical protein N4A71_10500 [Carboxylicivirga sp.]|jgi:hypothetical protein|nr:hypothetical protein [Carboxylicivirga sp.]MCT4646872.1 hypothetical protein [Carboxylicivirga sp.]